VSVRFGKSYIKLGYEPNGQHSDFTSLLERIQKQLETRECRYLGGFNDLDHDLEWCEEQILQTFEELGFAD